MDPCQVLSSLIYSSCALDDDDDAALSLAHTHTGLVWRRRLLGGSLAFARSAARGAAGMANDHNPE